MEGFLGIQTLPVQDAQVVARAFDTFEKSYLNDVRTILDPSGTKDLASNRAAFDAQVATDLNTLNTAIDTAIANITNTANTTLIQSIHDSLIGAGSTTLQSTLAAIKTPTSTNRWAINGFIWQSLGTIGQTERADVSLVAKATPPAGSILPSAGQALNQAIGSAYQTFVLGYHAAVNATATSPVTNRSAFDSAVSGLLTTLNSSLTTAINALGLPVSNASALVQTVTNDILTGTQTTTTNLQSTLAAIKSPSSSNARQLWKFETQSFFAIGQNLRVVMHDIVSAVNTYNASLTI